MALEGFSRSAGTELEMFCDGDFVIYSVETGREPEAYSFTIRDDFQVFDSFSMMGFPYDYYPESVNDFILSIFNAMGGNKYCETNRASQKYMYISGSGGKKFKQAEKLARRMRKLSGSG